jgi:hypothetical protein
MGGIKIVMKAQTDDRLEAVDETNKYFRFENGLGSNKIPYQKPC